MAETHVRLARAWDEPTPDDGYRVLVDRVWPRGKSRDSLALDAWIPSIAPSTGLRRWFGHDPERWPEFQARYRAEFAAPEAAKALDELAGKAREGPVTLVYGARDREHNQARVIADEIERRLATSARTDR